MKESVKLNNGSINILFDRLLQVRPFVWVCQNPRKTGGFPDERKYWATISDFAYPFWWGLSIRVALIVRSTVQKSLYPLLSRMVIMRLSRSTSFHNRAVISPTLSPSSWRNMTIYSSSGRSFSSNRSISSEFRATGTCSTIRVRRILRVGSIERSWYFCAHLRIVLSVAR